MIRSKNYTDDTHITNHPTKSTRPAFVYLRSTACFQPTRYDPYRQAWTLVHGQNILNVGQMMMMMMMMMISIEKSHKSKATILWNQHVQTDRTIPNNKPDIIIRDNENG